jgi:cbb3-type cytochrome oxidase subunit 1
MWIYHSHTHAALLGWITFSFIGMIYIVIPSIIRSNSLETLRSENALSLLLGQAVMKRAFVQLTVLLLSCSAILLAFFLESNLLLGWAGFIYGCAVYYLRANLLQSIQTV